MIEIKLEWPGRAPRVQRFASTVITVGRATECELCVDDPSLSRRHCRISRGPAGYVVEDLGSANGTAVAGERISGACAVTPGTAILVGDLRLEIVGRARVEERPRGGARAVVSPVPQDMAARTVGSRRASPARGLGLAGLMVVLVGSAGWASAAVWDRELVLPVAVAEGCRSDDPALLAADAAVAVAVAEVDAEAALRGVLRAFWRVSASACAGRSRADAALAEVLATRVESQRLGQHSAAVRELALAGDARVVALDEDGEVRVWDRSGPGRGLVGVRGAQAIARSAEGRWLAVADGEGALRWWDLRTEGVAPQVQREAHGVKVLAFAGDAVLVSGDAEGRLIVWRYVDEAWNVAKQLQAWPGVTRIEIAGDRLLAFGAGRAVVWQLGRGGVGVPLRTGAALTSVSLDPGGTQVIAGDAAGVVTRWQLGRRARAEALTAHAGPVRAVAWVGDAVASVGADDALRVAELGRRVRRDGPPLVLVAETPVPVDRLVAVDAGRWLVGVGRDGALVTWDLAQRGRRLPASLRRAGAVSTLVAGRGWVATGGADGVVRAWDLADETGDGKDGEDVVQRACRALGWSEPGCA